MEKNIPGKIIEINDKEIIVECGKEKVKANGKLVEDLNIGDYVFVSHKIVIAKIPKERAKKFLDLIK